MAISNPTLTPAWLALQKHYNVMKRRSLSDLFDEDNNRFDKFSYKFNGIEIDFSKQLLVENTLALLFDLANQMELEEKRGDLFSASCVNNTERRPALHVALRDLSKRKYLVNKQDVAPIIRETYERFIEFAGNCVTGITLGHTQKRFEKVVNIGIGGSDLGSKFVCSALSEFSESEIEANFVANIDGLAINKVLADANPETTLFIICSKSFSTLETLANAKVAKKWLISKLGEDCIKKHIFAVTSNQSSAISFGIDSRNIFPVWEWINGRYSIWSAIGLPVAISCGPSVFKRFISGAHKMDRHFETAPMDQNLPILMGLIGFWNRNLCKSEAIAILPYEYKLRFLHEYLQQLMMESNGKGVNKEGESVSLKTSPIVFGGLGMESQHSYMQFLHHSPSVIPSEFIFSLDDRGKTNQDEIVASAIAQSEALMRGLNENEVSLVQDSDFIKHKVCRGNRPSTSIMLDSITPENIGSLLALYEHRTFVEGVLLGINSFDQWAVELAKKLTLDLLKGINYNDYSEYKINHDSSTNGLWNTYLSSKRKND